MKDDDNAEKEVLVGNYLFRLRDMTPKYELRQLKKEKKKKFRLCFFIDVKSKEERTKISDDGRHLYKRVTNRLYLCLSVIYILIDSSSHTYLYFSSRESNGKWTSIVSFFSYFIFLL